MIERKVFSKIQLIFLPTNRLVAAAPLSAYLFILTFLGCNAPSSKLESQIKIHIPTASEFNKDTKSKVRSLSTPVDYDRLCFAVNVVGGKIASTAAQTCAVEKGMVMGSVPPGGDLSLTLETNQTVQFELYGFLRSTTTDPCPAVTRDNWSWPITKTYALGLQPGIVIEGPETTVEFTLQLPNSEMNLAEQNHWPMTCQQTQASQGQVNNGSALLTTSKHKLYFKNSAVTQLKDLKGQRFRIQGWSPR